MMKRAQFFPLGDINPTKGAAPLTWFLIGINILAFVIEYMMGMEQVVMGFGFIPASPSILTALTSMFLHGGVAHLLGNLWYLWIFGDNVEVHLGHVRFLLLYFFSGFAATLTHWFTNVGSEIPAVGASGAISGILGSYLVLFPRASVVIAAYYRRVEVPAFIMIGLWFLMQLFFAAGSLFRDSGSNVAFWAHVGGFVFGAAFTLILGKKRKN